MIRNILLLPLKIFFLPGYFYQKAFEFHQEAQKIESELVKDFRENQDFSGIKIIVIKMLEKKKDKYFNVFVALWIIRLGVLVLLLNCILNAM